MNIFSAPPSLRTRDFHNKCKYICKIRATLIGITQKCAMLAFFYSILLPSFCLSALGGSLDIYQRDQSIDQTPSGSIILCSDRFDIYSTEILLFADHFGIDVARIYDATKMDNRFNGASATLAFMGDPTKRSANLCLNYFGELKYQVDKAITNSRIPPGAVPGMDTEDKPESTGADKYCSMTYQISGNRKSIFAGISVGDLDCKEDIVASFFSYKLKN